jgi:hypothetical protein
MDWYLLSDQTQGWLNNTSVIQNMFFDRVNTQVGDSSFLNSDFFSFSSRTALNYIQPGQTNIEFNMYNFDIYDTTPIGGNPNQVQYRFRLTGNQITNVVDLRRGFFSSFAIFGGFMISIFFMCKTFVHFCANYEAEKTIADDLYTLNHSTVSSGAKSAQIHSSVTS